MKFIPVVLVLLASFLMIVSPSFAVESDVDRLLDLLIEKKVLTQEDAVGFRADLAVKKQDEKASQKEFTVIAGKPIKISGYTQIRYRQDEAINDSFDARRMRLDIKGDVTELFDYRFQSDFAGSSAKVLDATIGYKLNPYAKLTLGQFKIPFSLENLTSSPKLETINRSQVVEALVARGGDVIGNHNGRDIGVQAGGNFGTKSNPQLFEYAAGIFNGAGINTTDTNEKKDVVGRIVLHPTKEFSVGASAYTGKYTLSPSSTLEEDRQRFGGELAYARDRLSLKGEFIRGKDALINRDGWYVQAGYYVIPKKLQGVLKYDAYDPNKKLEKNETNVYTIGASWYFNQWALLQLNYELKDETGVELDNNAITSQLTLQF